MSLEQRIENMEIILLRLEQKFLNGEEPHAKPSKKISGHRAEVRRGLLKSSFKGRK